MSEWSLEIGYLARKVGLGAANAVRAIQAAIDDKPFEIVLYKGYGNSVKAHVYGRVIKRTGVTPSAEGDSVLKNLLNTYRRADADPLPAARVNVTFGGATTAMTTDDEGFFGGWVKSEAAEGTNEWHDYHAELGQQPDGDVTRAASGMLVPPLSARFGVISDIDDTVIQSRVSNFVQAAATVMLGNARTRLPFHGVAAFYRALREGASGGENNPVFYVSSSPWNLYDLITEFMELQNIPKGPLMLRDWDISLSALSSARHFEHKSAAIRNVMQLYPDLRFVLIGDTSQHDPEIYRQVVAEFPERVTAIYIRDVTRREDRSSSIQRLADEVRESASTLVLAEDTLGAAVHAVEHGLIAADAVSEIGDEKRVDEGSAG